MCSAHFTTKYYCLGFDSLYVCMRNLCMCVCLCFDDLKQVSDTFINVLNQGLIQFELKPEVRIIVYMTQQTLGEFVFKAK